MRPARSRSSEFIQAILKASADLEELGPKIPLGKLSPQEGQRLLTSNWQVYLYALADKDIEEAKEAAEFSNLITLYLETNYGYKVTFTNGIYCVVPKGAN